jgi:hypothetical protein
MNQFSLARASLVCPAIVHGNINSNSSSRVATTHAGRLAGYDSVPVDFAFAEEQLEFLWNCS